MKVVVVASEAVPFAKTGGLADVAGALPRALARLGHEATLILPLYRKAAQAGIPLEDTGHVVRVPVGSRQVEGRIIAASLPGTTSKAFLIDHPGYFDRDELYGRNGSDFPDNCERFAFFGRAVIEAIRVLGLRPDVIHGNDWQCGLIPVYLRESYKGVPEVAGAGTLLTVHNLAYQGVFWHYDLPLIDLDWRLFNFHQLEFHGKLNFLKAGLVFSDLLNTVSPTYAKEIQTPEFGCGLDALLRSRAADLRGIVNGIDTTIWNPATDSLLAQKYDSTTMEVGKAACKAQLQRRLGLPERPETPLFAQIGRLDPQKGWDLLASAADDLLAEDVQMVVLGEGQPRYHELLDRLSNRYPGKLRATLEFLPPLAHHIEAGADAFLMPSLYEPCGLNQLYSLAYGTVPIVHATGGLADTVRDTTPSTLKAATATGFSFRNPTAESFRQAILRALTLWPDRTAWKGLARTGMRQDWSWDQSARAYASLYEDVIARRRARPSG
jgi:starch synthase